MADLSSRLASRVQLTTDGLRVYMEAVEEAFGAYVDYAMLAKIYGAGPEPDTRYSSAECIGCREIGISGRPDPRHISTSFIEWQNLSMRMGIRRFARLTDAYSKKIENHFWAIALYYMHYNFARVHKTLPVTPAMQAGVSDHVWEISEIAALLPEPASKPLGPYRRRDSK